MILVDTSVWIDHLRRGDPRLSELLERNLVLVHPFVIGELACGRLHNRATVLGLLQQLPAAPLATQEEVLGFVARYELMGRGIGWIDAHLLAAARLAGAVRVWTRDRRLATVAKSLGLLWEPAG